MSFLRLAYYPDGASGPVADFLERLAAERPAAHIKLDMDLRALGAEGLRCRRITLRPLGEGLWELKRLFQGVQYRIFFCVSEGCAWLLLAIEKKSGKTPLSDMRLARRRLMDIIS